MVSPIRIGIVGTHSTGKTTLLRRIEMELRAVGVRVARTRGRLAVKAAELGFPKLQNQSAATTEWIISSGIADELEAGLQADVVLVDRAAPDPLAYYLAALDARGEHGDPAEVNRLRRLVELHAQSYTLLLATVLDPSIPLGDHRDRDPVYRARVHEHLHRLLADIPHQPVPSGGAAQDLAVAVALSAAQTEAAVGTGVGR